LDFHSEFARNLNQNTCSVGAIPPNLGARGQSILGKGIKLTGEDRQEARGKRQEGNTENSSYDLAKYNYT
jgi:hypothetical protein